MACSVIEHIEANYLSENGIVLNYKNAEYPQYLSESLGLYMQFLLGAGDQMRFWQQVDVLLQHFSVFKGNYLFVKWELGDNTTVGALIDDLRIAWVLQEAAEKFDVEEYGKLSETILFTIKETMIVNGRLVDFYDWHYNITKDQFFLSYYIIEAMGSFPEYVFKPLESLVADPFFAELYIEGEFQKASECEVNMIDQSLIAIAFYKRTGRMEPNFQAFIVNRLAEDGHIYARYRRDTLERVSENQSSATYAFLLNYFELTGQQSQATIIRELLLAMQTYDPQTTHFFDFINKELAIQNGTRQQDICGTDHPMV